MYAKQHFITLTGCSGLWNNGSAIYSLRHCVVIIMAVIFQHYHCWY